ncbi:MAG: class I SAM-dependent methyltransferase [Saprospiraceae bacterium]
MTIAEAALLIRDGVRSTDGTWADLGAGTGTFTQALQSILFSGKVFAVDKNPHALWRLPAHEKVFLEIVEADFSMPLDLPPLDGIIMANALHYLKDPAPFLQRILKNLKANGQFILVEYETNKANPPWIPYPIPFKYFKEIAQAAGFSEPREIGRSPSIYGHEYLYAASTLSPV